MGVTATGFDETIDRLRGFFDGFSEDLTEVGQVAAEGIVSQTLAGIGPDDRPFAPYSDSYRKELERLGGKPADGVDLRGIIPHTAMSGPGRQPRLPGAKQKPKGKGRVLLQIKGASVQLRRTPRGLVDPDSEMSLDLLHVKATDTTITISYQPRSADYMIEHNDGTGRAPQRQWMTLRRAGVVAAIRAKLEEKLQKRVQKLNSGK